MAKLHYVVYPAATAAPTAAQIIAGKDATGSDAYVAGSKFVTGVVVDPISALFANGEQGGWYDPYDMSTLYQDSAGTIPVTALGQPAGRMLDKSKGLVRGPELVVNGGFDSGSDGWDRTLTIVDGAAEVNIAGTVSVNDGVVESGKTYEFTLEIKARSTGMIRIRIGTTGTMQYPGIKSSSVGVVRGIATVVSGLTNYRICIDTSGMFVGAIDNISVRELPGNHASQPTATARPTLQADASGRKYLQFDGVDDKLTTTFPDLGSNVTIVRSVPGVGASILTGQTIGAGAWDDSTDHHGLLIIDRALTVPETALVTWWANLRAGV